MTVRLREFNENIAIVRPEERPWGFLAHAFAWVPVWGFLVNGLLWLYFRNRSREMVFHVQQAIQFQIYSLLPIIAWVFLSLLATVIGNLEETLGATLSTINDFLLSLILTVFAVVALTGGALVYAGKSFFYPFFGKKVMEGSIRKIQEG